MRITKRNFKFVMLSMILALCSCSSADTPYDASGVLPADGLIRVAKAGVQSPSSRGGQTDNNLLPFGLFITNAVSSSYSYANICMKYSGSAWQGYETGADDAPLKPMIWQNADQPVSITAYSPYDASAQATATLQGRVQSDQSATGNDAKSDLLYAHAVVTPSGTAVEKASVIYNAASKALNVKFAHQLCKVRVNLSFIKVFPEGKPAPLFDVSVEGTNDSWQMNMANGELSATTTTAKSYIRMKKEGTESYNYEAIIVPQTASISINIKTDHKIYVYQAPSQTYESGKFYTLNLKVFEDAVILEGGTVKDWNVTTIVDEDEMI